MHELTLHFRPKGGVKEYCQEDSSLLMLYPICTSTTSAPDDLSQFSVPVSVSVPVPVPVFRDFQLPGHAGGLNCLCRSSIRLATSSRYPGSKDVAGQVGGKLLVAMTIRQREPEQPRSAELFMDQPQTMVKPGLYRPCCLPSKGDCGQAAQARQAQGKLL